MDRYEVILGEEEDEVVFTTENLWSAKNWVRKQVLHGFDPSEYTIMEPEGGRYWLTEVPEGAAREDYVWLEEEL
ncbi:hypothetical protein LCGC14_0730770 [marine sediment metagenome]|uniref:Uncharacterized protein n=1 Tax=marine sediment metagenome TaxID=412755 RepID=A0A0F9TGW6_9ZZZZ